MASLATAPFWQNLERFGDLPAIFGRGQSNLTYRQLAAVISEIADQLMSADVRPLAFVELSNSRTSVLAYLGALAADCAVHVLRPGTPADVVDDLVAKFQPSLMIGPARICNRQGYSPPFPIGDGAVYCAKRPEQSCPVHADLALLLATSGSSGGGKLVKLSRTNISENARQITLGLGLGVGHRTVSSLPLFFVYGLSILHASLSSGAGLLVDGRPILSRALLADIRDYGVTVLSGVPWTFQTMRSAGMSREDLPTISKMTTSGAKIDLPTWQWMLDTFATSGVELFSMYGQTEAAGRIAILPPSHAAKKQGSVGRPVADGSISMSDSGELVFRGRNVMMGYASARSDLATGDAMAGVLPTGDLGWVDADGDIFLTGRLARQCKIGSVAVNLDEIADHLGRVLDAAVDLSLSDGRLVVKHEPPRQASGTEAIRQASAVFRIPSAMFSIIEVAGLDRTHSGKVFSGT